MQCLEHGHCTLWPQTELCPLNSALAMFCEPCRSLKGKHCPAQLFWSGPETACWMMACNPTSFAQTPCINYPALTWSTSAPRESANLLADASAGTSQVRNASLRPESGAIQYTSDSHSRGRGAATRTANSQRPHSSPALGCVRSRGRAEVRQQLLLDHVRVARQDQRVQRRPKVHARKLRQRRRHDLPEPIVTFASTATHRLNHFNKRLPEHAQASHPKRRCCFAQHGLAAKYQQHTRPSTWHTSWPTQMGPHSSPDKPSAQPQTWPRARRTRWSGEPRRATPTASVPGPYAPPPSAASTSSSCATASATLMYRAGSYTCPARRLSCHDQPLHSGPSRALKRAGAPACCDTVRQRLPPHLRTICARKYRYF